MTILYGFKFENGIILGSDKLSIIESDNGELKSEEAKKLIIGENFVLGIRGCYRALGSREELYEVLRGNVQISIDEEDTYENCISRIHRSFLHIKSKLDEENELENIYHNFFKRIEEGRRKPTKSNLSFMLGLKYDDKFTLHYSNYGENLVTSQSSVIGTPKSLFTEESGLTYSEGNRVTNIVRKRILDENKKYPKYCGGVEVILMNDEGIEIQTVD